MRRSELSSGIKNGTIDRVSAPIDLPVISLATKSASDFPPPLVPRELRFEVSARYLADGRELRLLDEEGLTSLAAPIAAAKVDCVVVCFLHSHAYRGHEDRAVDILKSALPADTHVLASTSVYGEFREYERFSTAVLNGVGSQ